MLRFLLQCKEKPMAVERTTNKILLAVACCLVLVLVPARSAAQGGVLGKVAHGIKKGADRVVTGVGAGVEKTKEGQESDGHKTKSVVTGEDSTSADRQEPTTQSTTPSETTSVVTGEDSASADRQEPTTQSTTPSETTRVVTGEDSASADRQEPTTQSTTPSETTPTKTTTTEITARTKSSPEGTKTEGTKGGKHLPGTTGELPLLAVGSLALAGVGALSLIRSTR